MAYTKTLRSPGIEGLKNAVVTYESKSKGGGLIPLSQRFDVNKRDVRYSLPAVKPSDAPYLSAVNHGDMETAQRMVDEKAREAGYIKAGFHRTSNWPESWRPSRR